MLCGLSVAAPLVLHFSDAVVSDGLWRCWMVAAFHFFAKEKLLFGHSSMKPRSVDICSDGCPFGISPISTQHLWSSKWPLDSWSHLLPRPFSLDCSVWSGSQLYEESRFSLLPFQSYGGHRALQCSRYSFVPFFRSVPQHSHVSELCRQFLQTHGLVFTLICIVSCETSYRHVCLFKSNPIDWIYHRWTPVNVEKHLKDDQEKWELPELNVKCHIKKSDCWCQCHISVFPF